MTTTKKTERVEPGQFDRLCTCGHRMGYHAQRKPYECLATGKTDCLCTAFTPKKEEKPHG